MIKHETALEVMKSLHQQNFREEFIIWTLIFLDKDYGLGHAMAQAIECVKEEHPYHKNLACKTE